MQMQIERISVAQLKAAAYLEAKNAEACKTRSRRVSKLMSVEHMTAQFGGFALRNAACSAPQDKLTMRRLRRYVNT